jgi:YggT family protein
MRALLDVVLVVLQLYWWIVIAMIILSWLISFNVVNTRNQFVDQVWRALNALTEPVLGPIRRHMPNFSGIDISPIILFLIIILIQQVIVHYLYPNVF